MDKQWRIVGLGDYANYYSYFTGGILHGAVAAGAWFRPVSLFGQSLEAVKEQVNFFKPHIILAHMIFNRKPHNQDQVFDMLRGFRKSGIKICYHMGDARFNPRYPGDISDIIDIGLVNNMIGNRFSSIWGIPCYHWPYGCMPQDEILSEAPKQYQCTFAFTGSLSDQPGHHQERTQFVRSLKEKGVDVKLFPNAETGNTRFQTAEMAAGAWGVLGVGMGEEIAGYLDVRPFQYIGAGALYFHNHSEAMKSFFEPGTHFVSYEKNNPNDLMSKEFEINPEKRISIIREGFKFCQEYHSMKARVKFVIDLIDGKVDKPLIYLEDLK
jgi:hypothetical protein